MKRMKSIFKTIVLLLACTVILTSCSKEKSSEIMDIVAINEVSNNAFTDPVISQIPFSLTKERTGTILLHGKTTSEYFYGISDVEIVWNDGSVTSFSTADGMRDYCADVPDRFTGYTQVPLTDGKFDGGIQLDDFNFDGYTDIGLQARALAYNQPYVYWFFSPETGRFQYHGNYFNQLVPFADFKTCFLNYLSGPTAYSEFYGIDESHCLVLRQKDITRYVDGTQLTHSEHFSDGTKNGLYTMEWESIQATSWQAAYRQIIQRDREKLLTDPEFLRFYEDNQVYVGIHDFDDDGTPELVFGDGVSLAVFTYIDHHIMKIEDIYFPNTMWCVNGVCFQGNALRAECNGSGGSAYVNFGYLDGQYLMGRYTELSPDIPCTVNDTVCTLEEITRIYPLTQTEYSDYLSGISKERVRLIHNGTDWMIHSQSGEQYMIDDTFDFSHFIW